VLGKHGNEPGVVLDKLVSWVGCLAVRLGRIRAGLLLVFYEVDSAC
jgi:hypothetical protein